jgi:sugar phosphate permease
MHLTKRWKIFSVLAGMLVISMFFRVSMAVVSSDLTSDLGFGAAELGVISGIFFYVFACAQIPLGSLLDRFGGRIIIFILGIVTTGGSLLFACASGYPDAVAGRALLGLGTAAVLMGSLKIYTNWFPPQEFARVSGFMIAVGNLGSIGATKPLEYVISHFGWRPTFVAASIVQLAVTLAVFLVTSDAPDDRKFVSAPAAAENPGTNSSIFRVWKLFFTSPAFWLVSMTAFFWYANYMVLLALWGGPYLREVLGLDGSAAGTLLLCISFGYICGSLLLGKVIDLVGGSLTTTMVIGQLILLLAMTAMLGPAELVSRTVLALIFFVIGLASASGVLIYPLARNLVPHRFAATAMTFVNFFLLLGAAAAQHAMGLYIHSFPRGASGYPATAYHGAFLMPICGLTLTVILFACNRSYFRSDASCE